METQSGSTVFSTLPQGSSAQNRDFNVYIKEWIDLENVMLYDYDKPMLEGATRDKDGNIIGIVGDECFQTTGFDNDTCEQKTTSNGKKCKVYKTSSGAKACAEEQHLKYTYVSDNPSNPNIYKSLSKQKYTIIQSSKITDNAAFNTANQAGVELFFKIFKSESTNNIYVLFSSGVVFDVSTLSDRFTPIIAEILSYHDYDKIIIGGHSMGCMIALHFANAIYRNPENRQFFLDKCIVIGSGPYKGYHYDDPLPNAKIFVSTLVKQREQAAVLNIDGYFVRSSGDLSKHYNPVVFINTDANNIGFVEDVDKMDNSLDSTLHMFPYYSGFLKKMLQGNTDFNKVDGSKEITDAVINKLPQNVSKKIPAVFQADETTPPVFVPRPNPFMSNELMQKLKQRKAVSATLGGKSTRTKRKSVNRRRKTQKQKFRFNKRMQTKIGTTFS